MDIPQECTFTGCFVDCWLVLIALTMFSFSGGYIIHALQAANGRFRGDDDDQS